MTERAQPVALVTGAGRGLGRAIAGTLHRDGYKVAVTDVDEGAAVSVASHCRQTEVRREPTGST